MPGEWFFLDQITVVEQRVIGLFVLAACLWIFESIPIYATSVLIIVIELVFLSDAGWRPFRESSDPNFGTLLSYKEVMGTFASPIILLFLGGFFLALASTKYRLDQNLARVLLKPFGKKPQGIMLGLMIITAVFSMFMSNTATTAMMLSILTPVLVHFGANDQGKVAFTLSIPIAANIGGLGTPIGTPPNALALKYLVGENSIGFGEWMSFGVPIVILLLMVGWLILNRFFPSDIKEVNLNIQSKFLRTRKAIIVYVTMSATILLWLLDFLHGMNSYIVATIPMAVFLIFNVITKEDLKKLSWDVLWLVSGGIALGMALDKSGLVSHLVGSIPFTEFSPYFIIVLTVILSMVMATFMSNTATANLLLPIILAIGISVASLEELGGAKMLIIGATLATSLGMALPISTPPNSLAYASGLIETKDMARSGVAIGLIGVLLVFVLLVVLNNVGFFS